jgi:hypothetical protein
LVGVIPPPVGAFAQWSGPGWDIGWGFRRWARERCCAEGLAVGVGDGQVVGGSGDGEDPAVVQPVVIGAQQHEIVEVGGAAVFPMGEVMGM